MNRGARYFKREQQIIQIHYPIYIDFPLILQQAFWLLDKSLVVSLADPSVISLVEENLS